MLICCCAGSEYIAHAKYVVVVAVNWGCAGGESAETNGRADLIADLQALFLLKYFLRMDIPSIVLVCYACLTTV